MLRTRLNSHPYSYPWVQWSLQDHHWWKQWFSHLSLNLGQTAVVDVYWWISATERWRRTRVSEIWKRRSRNIWALKIPSWYFHSRMENLSVAQRKLRRDRISPRSVHGRVIALSICWRIHDMDRRKQSQLLYHFSKTSHKLWSTWFTFFTCIPRLV